MAHERVTIADIAREVGLSVGTVSNALNRRRPQVSERTIEKVVTAANRLGYRGNSAAAALRTGRYGAVSLHLPESVRSLNFYMEFTFGVEHAISKADFDLVLVSSDRKSKTTPVRVDGAIVVDWTPKLHAPRFLHDAGVPILAAGRQASDLIESTPAQTIWVNYAPMVSQIVTAAAKSGAKRFAMIAPDDSLRSDWAVSIVDGFNRAVEELELPGQVINIPVTASPARIIETALSLCEAETPDCVIFGPQRFAGIAKLHLGWGVPGSNVPYLASCAGDPLSELSDDALTSISAAPWKFGERCGKSIVEILGGAEFPKMREHRAKIIWGQHWAQPRH
ncbi:LacI family DNA-binding transcriptional regulator [uncultured Gulosibacter sp.]|uniref:LacI family DNA-binding transcriptional regulator n=1 Tax=uncultured Gulosibacter sp. TaxID=1339167 RepID=UPI00288AA380|nr:LacI family DNA-binding transcriptional regulator [uncultured Gulosibacter sp.]